ncbi:MAG: AbrB family transcriptional regulator [Synergistaceae bacterium]|nr:AbrB family transcriptional regulator [Synergistaceae bacterium]
MSALSWLVIQFSSFCLIFALGALGFSVFKYLKLPNPALLGPMFATGALSVMGYFPPLVIWPISLGANIMTGVMTGHQIERNTLRRIVKLLRPVFVQTTGMLLLSLVCGYTMYYMARWAGADVSLKTALISGAGGGITEMTAFGMSADADVAVIAFVQVFRVVTFLALIPYLSRITKGEGRVVKSDRDSARHFGVRDYAVMGCAALLSASLAYRFKIPAGALLGAMIACGVYSVLVGKSYTYDARIRWITQVCLGMTMGQRMTPRMVLQLGTLFIPAVTVTLVMLAGCLALAFLLRKTTGWDVVTCLLCAAPAGLSQISVYAEEVGADSLTASVFHSTRIIGIVSIYPWIVMPLSS